MRPRRRSAMVTRRLRIVREKERGAGMRKLLVLGLAPALMLVATMLGAGSASAQTITPSATGALFNLSGSRTGSVAVASNGSGGMFVGVQLTQGAPSTPYSVCVTDPLS